MSKYKKPYRLKKRGKYYYYKLPNEEVFHSTGETSKTLAEQYVSLILQDEKSSFSKTLREYAEPFYIWETCPHIRKLRDEKKSIGKRHVSMQRQKLEKYVFTDSISNKKLSEISRGDILDFRSRLINKKAGMNTINKTVGLLKTIFNEALFREEINKNPTLGIGNINYETVEVGIFSEEELQNIFPENNLGPWKGKLEYTCFFLAGVTGMRRGEILALRWKDINFEESYLTVNQAWKDKDELGKPKWDKIRSVPLPEIIIEKLRELQDISLQCLPDNFVFCYSDGSRLGGTWWSKRFNRAMKIAKINKEERNLRPHSFRHTLNTILKSKGYSSEMIRASLGWSSEKVQDGYTHFQAKHLNGQAEIINNIWKK